MKNKQNKGFTLVELMVVIAIVGVLASVVIPNVQEYSAKARNASRMADLTSLEVAIITYKDDVGSYPNTFSNWWGEYDYGNHPHEGSNGYVPNLAPTYMRRLPADPMAGKTNPAVGPGIVNGFLYRSNGRNYKLLSHRAPEAPNHHYGDDSFKFHDPVRSTWAWAAYSADARNL